MYSQGRRVSVQATNPNTGLRIDADIIRYRFSAFVSTAGTGSTHRTSADSAGNSSLPGLIKNKHFQNWMLKMRVMRPGSEATVGYPPLQDPITNTILRKAHTYKSSIKNYHLNRCDSSSCSWKCSVSRAFLWCVILRVLDRDHRTRLFFMCY